MHRFLQRTRALLGQPPRRLGVPTFKGPRWVDNDAVLGPVLAGAPELLRRGSVRWGAVIQANQVLFSPEGPDAPAVVLVGLDDVSDRDPGALHYAALECAALKMLDDDAAAELPLAEKALRTKLRDETAAFVGHEPPRSVVGNLRCVIHCMLILRDHLPAPLLAREMFPVVVGDDPRQGAVVLPSTWWAPALREVWW